MRLYTSKKKIHIGCGKRNFGDSWYHIDADAHDHIMFTDVYLNDFDTESMDIIYASHFLEYFSFTERMNLLTNWRRVLVRGGILRLAVPNMKVLCELYASGKITLDQMLGPVYGEMKSNKQIIYHKTGFDENKLRRELEFCGFKNVKLYDWRDTEHANVDDQSQAYIPHMDKENGVLISLNMECVR